MKWVANVPPVWTTVPAPVTASNADVAAALAELARTEEGVSVSVDLETSTVFLGCRNEQHLNEITYRLWPLIGDTKLFGPPSVTYLETILLGTDVTYTTYSGPKGALQFARVQLQLIPTKDCDADIYESEIDGARLAQDFVAGVEAGVRTALATGPLHKAPVVGVKVVFTGGAFDPTSTPKAFEFAAKWAMRDGLKNAKPVLLEPFMRMHIDCQDRYVGGVVGDIVSRRGYVTLQSDGSLGTRLQVCAPMANLWGYIHSLRRMTEGKAFTSMAYSHHEIAPPYATDPDDKFPMAMAMRA